MSRMVKIIRHDGSKESYGYDVSGMLNKAANSDAEVLFERDVMGRIIKENSNGNEVSSAYNQQGRRTRLTSSLGADIEAAYNPFGDLDSIGSEGWTAGLKHDNTGLEIERLLPGNIRRQMTHDNLGRVTEQKILRNTTGIDKKEYLWGKNDRLLLVNDNGKERHYEYDKRGYLTRTQYADGSTEIRVPDNTGNLYETLNKSDRKYGKGGQLIKTERWEYKYDDLGNLVRKKDKHGQTWRYEWNDAGMLSKVKRPDAAEVTFRYDALGRRIEKCFNNRTYTRWLWDGNVPLHEWREVHTQGYESGKAYAKIENHPVTTWLFEEGTFVPAAKLTENKKLSIVSNYMGTPEAMYDEEGRKSWSCELSSYGKVRSFEGEYKTDCPFRYQGQYEDAETGLYYNRFRYYSPDEGVYISQDPIRLGGGLNLYSYVQDTNGWIDKFGLKGTGGAYIFDVTATHADGTKTTETYIGKGQEGRMDTASNSSMKQRTAEMQKKHPNSTIEITASSRSNTNNNNELGKMTENRLMHNADFEPGKPIPDGYLNKTMSGNTAWNDPKNAHLRSEAERIAAEMEADMNRQRAKNSLCNS
jgi:RHS repeat-associated protein